MKKEWIDRLLSKFNRKTVTIFFDYSHFQQRENSRNLDIVKVEKTVRFGRIDYQKSRYPNVIFLHRYFGKENISYIVCVWIYSDFWEVKTTWTKKGRK